MKQFFSDLYAGETHIDFTRAWKRGLALSAVLVAVSVGALAVRGLNLGIDFEGGTVWEVPIGNDIGVAEARDALTPLGQGNAKIQLVGGDTLSVQAGVEAVDATDEITVVLSEVADAPPDTISVASVGPSWGDEITREARQALIVFFALIALYITLSLEWKMAVGALAAVVHDIIVSVGFYAVFQFEVTPATVIAFLTILGYSLYDTIVVFDKVRENTARLSTSGRMTYTGLVNLSMNQVLTRSLNTTFTTIVPVVSMLVIGSVIFGAVTLRDFALALFIGLLSGAYSSIFIAAPTLVALKEREPRNRALRERLERGDSGPAPSDPEEPAARRSATSGSVIAARPRKAKRKRHR
ncbi:MAG: protein translocase subunit SecF [Actinomycetota bacterium]